MMSSGPGQSRREKSMRWVTRKCVRKMMVGWSIRRSALMVPLVGCVIVLQGLILLRMSSESSGEENTLREVNANYKERYFVKSYSPYTTTDNPHRPAMDGKATNMFDLESCSCGLHFKVDPSDALLLPRPNVTAKKYLAIGIPTIKRRDDSYIIKTVTSLLSNMDAQQQKDVVIIIMIADVEPEKRNYTLQALQSHFPDSIKAGAIHVIAPPPDLYSNFKVTKQTYDQPIPYVEWRAKQNFDYAYLMRYSAPLSVYYMQLEDDVIAAKNYVAGIHQYIDEQKDPWTCLEFSELGFIGKLFRSKEVDRLSQMLMMFFQEQPVDYTYLYFNMLMTQLQKRIKTPTLFQHQGVHSSFPGKIQPLKDRFFDNMEKLYKGDNPAAEIYTTMKTYLNFLPRLPYSHVEGYFWTDGAPALGDTFIVVFEVPQQLERVVIETGSESHPDDILRNASLKASLTIVKNSARLECTNDVELGEFKDGRIEVKNISSSLKFKAVCLQIQVLKEQESWAIIREIAVFVVKQT